LVWLNIPWGTVRWRMVFASSEKNKSVASLFDTR
jgi:hypothetical protein